MTAEIDVLYGERVAEAKGPFVVVAVERKALEFVFTLD